jgi:predicted metal-dependent hydrolase
MSTINKSKSKLELFYLGKKYPLKLRANKKSIVEFEDALYVASINPRITKRYLTSWYRQQARKIISQRVNYYAKISGSRFNTMGISDANTNWGSCSTYKNLHFNWRLVMAPLPVIDYVITHELAHLTEMNHSRQFWETVRKMFPLYRQYRTWLKRNGEYLKI